MKTSIIGGGIAGLATSIALARRGQSIVIYEQAKAFETIGAGVQLGPNAVRALQRFGAWEAVEPLTTQPKALTIRNGRSGKVVKTLNLAKFEHRFGAPYRTILRADLHAALLNVAESFPTIEIELRSSITVQDLTGSIIVADGLWSQSREKLFGTTAKSEPTTFYRALLDKLPQTDIDLEDVTLWQYPGGHIVQYLVGQKPKLNLVGIAPHDPLRFFNRAAPELAKLLTAAQKFTPWPAAYVPPLNKWHKGQTLLIGDAAHGTLPYLAQGAAMALEDAAALMTTNDFTSFQAARKPRCDRLHRQTLRQGKIYHLSGPAAFARDVAMQLISERMFYNQLSWLYDV